MPLVCLRSFLLIMNEFFTEKLFHKNSYQNDCKANILKTSENYVILDKTVFYPEAGGQPGDIGKIIQNENEVEILNTASENGYIKHFIKSKIFLKKSQKVHCVIDWERRYNFMKVHSCLHILCSLIHSPVTGGSIGLNRGRLDFDLENKPNKDELTKKLQQLINENYEISSSWISDEELDRNPNLIRTMSVAPPRGTGKIRMIRIGENIDYQPCGGTHVKHTNEIGNVKVSKIENKGKRNKRIIVNIE